MSDDVRRGSDGAIEVAHTLISLMVNGDTLILGLRPPADVRLLEAMFTEAIDAGEIRIRFAPYVAKGSVTTRRSKE